MQKIFIITLTLLLSLLIAACGAPDVPEVESPEADTPAETSPLPTPANTSPLPPPTEVSQLNFELDQASLDPGSTTVTGSGPAGLRIRIVDVSWGGEIKGVGQIEEDGTFSIDVTPIEAGNDIGIMLEDIGDSELTQDEILARTVFRDIPLVGIILDMKTSPKQ